MLFLTLFVQIHTMPLQKPIIGIYTQSSPYESNDQHQTYIAASYVKYLQMAGAQVIPIYYTSSKDQIKTLMGKINGILFPGGGMQFNMSNTWTNNADYILKLAKQMNDNGDVFPIWGTCLGFQLLSYLASDYNNSVLKRVQGESYIVRPVYDIDKQSKLFYNFSQNLIQQVSQTTNGIYYFNHHYCITQQSFQQYGVNRLFKVIGKAKNKQGFQFVAAIQSDNYPFFAVQFHPEKSIFEYRIDSNKTRAGIEATQYLANYFVDLSLKSRHSFDSLSELTSHLIYNTKTTVLPSDQSKFSQIYIFKQQQMPKSKHLQRNSKNY